MKTYLAITIGPIYQTFSIARHTREVWGASYIFSYIAKGIILKLIDSNIKINAQVDFEKQIKSSVKKFVLPNIGSDKLFSTKSSAGLFPDNIIVEADILGNRNFEEIRNAVIKELSNEIAEAIGKDLKDVKKFLNDYLRILHRILTVDRPILDVTPSINLAEQEPFFATQIRQNYLSDFFKTINNKKNGFMKSRGIQRFESLVEIATIELREKAPQKYNKLVNQYLWNDIVDIDSDGEFIKALSSKEGFADDFKTYHKYIAVVLVDGDKIGATLKGIHDPNVVKQFSEKLLNWAIEMDKLLNAWKAKAIYIGGDDLLFFAPIVNHQSVNIFDLAKQIDDKFNEQNWEELETKEKPTLSFGISITYYKYPLIEALETAKSLLRKAKDAGGDQLAIRFLKHSGAELPFTLNKNDVCFDNIFKDMDASSKETKSLLSRVSYKIRENEPVFEIMGKDETRMKEIFKNVFEEVDCEDPSKKPKPKDYYLKSLRELMVREYKNADVETAHKQVFSLTRAIKFIKGLDELKD